MPTQQLYAPHLIILQIDTALLQLPYDETLIIGRKDDASGVQPDLDLDRFAAREQGVSRRHIRIRRADNIVFAKDLGSANGTCLNNERLESGIEYPLHNGDKLRLGNLELTVLFQ